MRFLIATAALFVATSAAAVADLKVSLVAPTIVDRGSSFVARATVENGGPGTAFQSNFTLQIRINYSTVAVCYDGVVIGNLAPGESRVYHCTATIPLTGPRIHTLDAHASVSSPVDDPARLNNQASVFATVASAGPDVSMHLRTPKRTELSPALPVPVTLFFRNMSRSVAAGAIAVIESPHGFGAIPTFCSVLGKRATCRLGDLPAIEISNGREIELEVMAPDVSDTTPFEIRASLAFDETDTAPEDNTSVLELQTIRTIFVTSTSDSGEGSLRAAIEAANDPTGSRTLIAFRIRRSENGWHTITPLSPLPPVTSRSVLIDGTTQAQYFGDTNPAGPEIEINGSATTGANGLELSPICAATVRGLAINGFGGAGIVADWSGPCGGPSDGTNQIEKNFLGIDPTGTRAVPNGRGLVLMSGYRVRENVVSGNSRAGIFATRGNSTIEFNTVGIGPKLDRVLANGASGIYVGPDASYTDVENNRIEYNGECGLAIGWGAVHVGVRGNSFHANGTLGIDYGINGPSPAGPVPVPEITSATFSGGKTIVEGRTRRTAHYRLSFYANDRPDAEGFGEGQYFLGEIEVLAGNAGTFRFVYEGDLRQKFVTATITQLTRSPASGFGFEGGPQKAAAAASYGYDGPIGFTSEFSRAVQVR